MRRVALLGLVLLASGCNPYRNVPGAAQPGVGVVMKGGGGRCAPVLLGTRVRRVCLPPSPVPDSARDSLAVAR